MHYGKANNDEDLKIAREALHEVLDLPASIRDETLRMTLANWLGISEGDLLAFAETSIRKSDAVIGAGAATDTPNDVIVRAIAEAAEGNLRGILEERASEEVWLRVESDDDELANTTIVYQITLDDELSLEGSLTLSYAADVEIPLLRNEDFLGLSRDLDIGNRSEIHLVLAAGRL
jgi:hypothetical protein